MKQKLRELYYTKKIKLNYIKWLDGVSFLVLTLLVAALIRSVDYEIIAYTLTLACMLVLNLIWHIKHREK